jgi:hypothetical protein
MVTMAARRNHFRVPQARKIPYRYWRYNPTNRFISSALIVIGAKSGDGWCILNEHTIDAE